MINKDLALKISVVVLFLAGTMDVIRGFMHTFQVRVAAEQFAQIELTSDSLVLMSAFGISNFLTAFIYFLVIWKARDLAPYILLLIPISYFIGGLGMKYQNVQLESAFVGQYMMAKYLTICLVSALVYFTAKRHHKTKKNKHDNQSQDLVLENG